MSCVRLLFSKGMKTYRPRRTGERKRKSVRGCIVSSEIAALHLVVQKKGEQDIPGLTDENKPRRLGPKRAANIRKVFNLTKEDDVRQFVVRREAGKKKEWTGRVAAYNADRKAKRAAEVAKKKEAKKEA